MTTEAKLKKLEEDQIIMEDQNCKLAKVGLVCHAGTGKAGRCRAEPACLFTYSARLCSAGSCFSQGSQGLWHQLHV